MNSRCGSIVKKFFNSQSRSKTSDKHQKVDRVPRGKLNPTPIGPVTITGEKPTVIGTITVVDTTNCATKPETPKNFTKIRPKRLFKTNPPKKSDTNKDSSKERNNIKLSNTKSRNKTPGKHLKIDRSPIAKINPTPIGPVTVTGEKPTLIGTVTKVDITNCATEPVTPENPTRIKPKKTF